MSDTQITSLPKGLKVDGVLDISYTLIRSLPKGLKISGGLYLDGTGIREIPSDAEIGGRITGLPFGMAEKIKDRKAGTARDR